MQQKIPKHPFVTIAIANYNYGRYLNACLESAINQCYSNKEVIVIDDGSTDESRSLLEKWIGRAKVIYKENGGQISVYNEAIARARGDILIFLDADDLLDAGAVSRVVEAFAPGVVKVHYRLRLVGADGVPLGGVIPNRLSQGSEPRKLLLSGCLYDSAPGSGNAYATWALRLLAPLPQPRRERHGGDFYCVYSVPFLGDVAAIQAELGAYRVHHDTVTTELSFGNANRGKLEPTRTFLRYRALRRWLKLRLPHVPLPARTTDFSIEKIGFARAVLGTNSYMEGLKVGSRRILPLARSIVKRPGNAFAKPALLVWACAVLILPRAWGEPVARYVCNPASRQRS